MRITQQMGVFRQPPRARKDLRELRELCERQIFRFSSEVAGTDEIKFWIMSWGSKAEVLEPTSLREEIRREAEAVMNTYRISKRHEKSAS